MYKILIYTILLLGSTLLQGLTASGSAVRTGKPCPGRTVAKEHGNPPSSSTVGSGLAGDSGHPL